MLFNHLYFDMYFSHISQSNQLTMDKIKTHSEIYHIMEAKFVYKGQAQYRLRGTQIAKY